MPDEIASATLIIIPERKQSPDDLAAGTCMNESAEVHTCLVAYPGQTSLANMQKCWNWFNPRGVYIGERSAGGAAAAILGEAYPDLYAAIGVHSGLACGSARERA